MSSSRPMNVLTVDVEDWYHCLDPDPGRWARYEPRVVEETRRVLRLLDAAGTTATFFVLGDVAERHPGLVREIDAAGHEVGSHGRLHRLVYEQSEPELEADLRASLEVLRALVGRPVLAYRAPYFSIVERSRWAYPLLSRLGLRWDSSVHPVHNSRYGNPRAPRLPHAVDGALVELPITTYPLGRLNLPCGGGVYFRFLPYAVTRALFRRLVARGERIVFYLHPWELDAGQPRIPLPAGLRLRHYFRLGATERKLATLLGDFRFGSIRDVLGAPAATA